MCGIAGIFGIVDKADAERRVSSMVRGLAHRGPDDEGFLIEQDIALGHRRLSIIDLSPAGHQPMRSDDGRYEIVYNGELYNFQQIKARLPDYPFRSRTDTEVILAA